MAEALIYMRVLLTPPLMAGLSAKRTLSRTLVLPFAKESEVMIYYVNYFFFPTKLYPRPKNTERLIPGT